MKDGIILEKHRVIPKYDKEICILILEHFHDQANYREYHKTFSAISEKHIGIIQEESQGQIEQLNQTVGHDFTKLLWDRNNQLQKKDWINVIDMFVMSYNSTIHKAHGCTLHEAIFRWKMYCVYDTSDFFRTITASETSTSEIITVIFKTTVFETITSETITDEAAMEQRISHMLKIHQSINASLEKYCEKLGHNNMHRKKTANNTIETGIEIAIVPDHDMNQQTRKRKL
ncbi:12413_t:CDS:2 [Acaulospora morrowiae]|uniref:12413_t:CDS:1 n=1 Tax=Acaulospora morrowiae TaxID=94023 RepID=A0A9N9CU53_9GLOM|nr:12413_t:CDS:2 [Acaulospora morrowiae]